MNCNSGLPLYFISALFEPCRHGANDIVIGYATNRAWNIYMNIYNFADDVVSKHREYLVSFIGQSDDRKAYKYRKRLQLTMHGQCNNTFPCVVMNDTFIQVIHTKPSPMEQYVYAPDIIKHSLMTVSLPGDTPTTSRFQIAFDYLTLIGALSHARNDLLRTLPFPHRVPWDAIIVWIDTNAYMRSPVTAMRETALALTHHEISSRRKLMLQYRKEIVWMHPDSRVHINIIEDACMLAKQIPS